MDQVLVKNRIYQLGMSSFVPVLLHESSGFVFGGNYPQDEDACPPGCHYVCAEELRQAIIAARDNPDALPQTIGAAALKLIQCAGLKLIHPACDLKAIPPWLLCPV
jgi:hypothetical protein